MNETHGGPAFPTVTQRSELREHGYREINDLETGMSLRDYFAAQALTGILVHLADWRAIGGEPDQVAEWAYELADAMLKERSK